MRQSVAIQATALVALISAVAAVTRRIDRRHLLIGFSALLIASNLLVAAAPTAGGFNGARNDGHQTPFVPRRKGLTPMSRNLVMVLLVAAAVAAFMSKDASRVIRSAASAAYVAKTVAHWR